MKQFDVGWLMVERQRASRLRQLLTAFVCTSALATLNRSFAETPVAFDTAGRMTDVQLPEAGFAPLGDGRSLRGWNVQPWHEGHWIARHGVIDYDGKAEHKRFEKNTLWTEKDYGDLVLYAEWRLPAKPRLKPHPIVLFNGDFLLDEQGQRITRPRPDAGDSGILLRGVLACQANIWCQELGSGEINGYRTNRSMPPEVRRAAIPIKKADRPLGEWNVFLVTLKAGRMTVELNGEKVIDAAHLPGLPKFGPVGLQHHGDPVQFRRLWIRELD
jgi:Domain of Unknown Function (DUF1080)